VRWQVDSDVTKSVAKYTDSCLDAYEVHPDLVPEHFAIEREIAEGGYGRRQIYELVQNGADAILQHGGAVGGRIEVVLTPSALYCANEGAPIDVDGVRAILGAHRSSKRSNEIGRFGLGFKSVLAVTDAPEFFSTAGSFRFDPVRSSEAIARAVEQKFPTPKLRLAFPLDPTSEMEGDPVLAELGEWATTVIRLPLAEESAWLLEDLENFPPEFALFSDHVGQLVLRDEGSGFSKSVSAVRRKSSTLLTVDGATSEWRTCHSSYSMSPAARKSAGELADRETLPLVWAVPLDTTRTRGAFWAFFPTEYWTTLRGILNAPWKTNADRQNLLKGSFNAELIESAAEMIVKNLKHLSSEDDPARHLDYLPGRGREAPQWADEQITEDVYYFAANAKTIPDLDGKLCKPADLQLHPDGVPSEALKEFARVSLDRDWVHPSVEVRQRRARVARLMESRTDKTLAEWLSTLIDLGDLESSTAAIGVASFLEEGGATGWRSAPIVLTRDGSLSPVDPELLYFAGMGASPGEGVRVVSSDLANDVEVRERLTAMGIRTLDAEGQLAALALKGDTESQEFWVGFWKLASDLGAAKTQAIVNEHLQSAKMRARNRAGEFIRVGALLIPGGVVAEDDHLNDTCLVDMRYHGDHREVLRWLGVVETPVSDRSPYEEYWFDGFKSEYRKRFAKNAGLQRPKESLLKFSEGGYVGPCEPLKRLDPEANADYCMAILQLGHAARPWLLAHANNSRYEKLTCPNPSLWMVRKHGFLRTSVGRVEAEFAVGRALAEFASFLPVVEVDDDVALQLKLPMTLEDVRGPTWAEALHLAFAKGPDVFGQAMGLVLNSNLAPIESVPDGHGGVVLLKDVVASLAADARALRDAHIPHAVVSSQKVADRLVEEWNFRAVGDLFSVNVRPIQVLEQVKASELFPALPTAIEVVVSEQLEVERASQEGSSRETVTSFFKDNVLYLSGDPRDLPVILDAVVHHAKIDLADEDRVFLLGEQDRKTATKRRREVARKKTPAEKVLSALGVANLKKRLPVDLVEEMAQRGGADLAGVEIAELALAVHGVEVLQVHREDLAKEGFDVPLRWAGMRKARKFVTDLGFPVEYAGFASESRDPLVVVEGPPRLPPLHQFQAESVDRIRELVDQGMGRGLLSLPTGAGKTRTATHALIEAMRDGALQGPILWVAQSDELCEQAVGAWSENWRALGPDSSLKLGRLWANNDVENLNDQNQVVVATIQKLDVCIPKRQYSWLARAKAVVIDEAHRATATSYTKLLEWLGMGRNQDRVPLIGLSATPYRGTSAEETDRLVKRFGGKRLDAVGEDPYKTLQEMGVLSNVEHRLLTGSDVSLTADELAEVEKLGRLPASVLSRIGEDKGRNQTILDSIRSIDGESTVLLFSASVTHAELMAGLLSASGIEARAISAATSKGSRRHYIEQFRSGDIRVLTNYGVLTEGFDAPSVSAVYLARPTYSPNLYQQMVGRGLRGPLNGGKETCLIVNVEDNLAQYGRQLAFREFEPLWNRT